MRRVLGLGLGLALVITAFTDVAVLTVPLYDMQLYDRVLQSRNMDTLTMLSIACVLGLLLYGLLDYFRSACFIAIGEAVGRHLEAVVLTEGVRRAARGERRAGPELLRDLNELQHFLSSGAPAVPLDALCTPLFLTVSFMLHPVFGWVGVAGIALLVMVGLAGDTLVRPALTEAETHRTEAAHILIRRLAEPELADGLGMLPAIGRQWATRHGHSLSLLFGAGARALGVACVARLLRLGTQSTSMALGAMLVVAGAATPGSLMGSNLLLNKMLAPFDHIVQSWRHWAMAQTAWRRIDRLLAETRHDTAPRTDPDGPAGLLLCGVGLTTSKGTVLLHGIDLVAPPGVLVVVTGANGAGKTTLLRLIAGLEPPTTGIARLDGAPLHGGPGIGFLPQSVALLAGTIRQNIACFQPDDVAGAVAAARRAGVHDLIGRLPRGYDTALRQAGTGLSGGMRQRIGLARALHGDRRLVVLDEPDANLDTEGADALFRALKSACADGAVVVVTSHRQALEAAADIVLHLSDGTVAPPPAPALVRRANLATA